LEKFARQGPTPAATTYPGFSKKPRRIGMAHYLSLRRVMLIKNQEKP